ncbi:MAG: hypothetical protein K1060chlam1_00772 [Candidatus Anoxychlamydiales bacterium]|nr:hypothetical protein [Candidatus Anoxychlamydiales bacterium]
MRLDLLSERTSPPLSSTPSTEAKPLNILDLPDEKLVEIFEFAIENGTYNLGNVCLRFKAIWTSQTVNKMILRNMVAATLGMHKKAKALTEFEKKVTEAHKRLIDMVASVKV